MYYSNLQNSIEDKITASSGDPAPKRNPKGKLGVGLVSTGLGMEVAKEVVEGSKPKDNPQQGNGNSNSQQENSNNQDKKSWWQRIKGWFD